MAIVPLQRLMEAHKVEMMRAEQRHEAEVSRRLEEQVAAVRSVAAAEHAAALEVERAAARDQIKDAQNR